MKMATAETLEPQTAVEIGVEEWLQPRHWGAPADISIKRVSEPLGVMSTEKGLEEYRRNKMEQKRFGAGALGKREGEVVRRLCDPKLFTGTAATGHLPTTVDLEGGVGVLLKDAPIAVKDHVGAQEVSWRLRLAERL